MRIGLLTVGANITLNLILMWPMREAGLALATAITAMLQSVVLLTLASRRFRGVSALIDTPTARGIGASILGAGIMALAIFGVRQLHHNESGDALTPIASLAIDVGVGLAVYLGIAVGFRRAEWSMLVGGLLRRSAK